MTDDEILRYFSDKSSRTCGHFRRDQMKSYVRGPMSKKPTSLSGWKAAALSFVLIAGGKLEADAEEAKPKVESVRHTTDAVTQSSGTREFVVRGIVKSAEDDMPLPGINIVLKGTMVGTITGDNGQFEFPQKLVAGDVLIFSFIGLKTVEYQVSAKDSDGVTIGLEMDLDYELMGEVQIAGNFRSKSGLSLWWERVRRFF